MYFLTVHQEGLTLVLNNVVNDSTARGSDLGQYTFLGPQLHQHSLQVTEVLIVGELAGTQLAPCGITVGHTHSAGAL